MCPPGPLQLLREWPRHQIDIVGHLLVPFWRAYVVLGCLVVLMFTAVVTLT